MNTPKMERATTEPEALFILAVDYVREVGIDRALARADYWAGVAKALPDRLGVAEQQAACALYDAVECAQQRDFERAEAAA